VPLSSRYLDEFIDFDDELKQAIMQRKRILLVAFDEAFLVPPFTISARQSPFIWLTDRLCFGARLRRRQSAANLLSELDACGIEYYATGLFSLSESCEESTTRRAQAEDEPFWATLLGSFINWTKSPFKWVDLFPPTEWYPGDEDEDDDDLTQLCRFLQEDQAPAPLPESAEKPAAEPAAEPQAAPDPVPPVPSPVPQPAIPRKRRVPALIRESSGETIELPEGIFYIGSDPLNADYCLEMPDVRDRHMAFRTDRHNTYIQEIGITDTRSPYYSERLLQQGDFIAIGEERFFFRYF